MSVVTCIAKLVSTGRITAKLGQQATQLYQSLQGTLGQQMPAGSAAAQAALQTAQILHQAAQARRVAAAKSAIAQAEAMQRIAAHPQGRTSGLMAEMVVDRREAGTAGANIESLAESLLGRLMARFNAGAEGMRTRLGGITQDRPFAERTVLEIFGHDTGDAQAKAAARGWEDAAHYGVLRAKAGGKVLEELADWRVPQHWRAERLAAHGSGAWTNDMFRHVQSGALTVLDRNTGAPAAATDIPAIVAGAFDNITRGGGRSGGTAFNPEMRVFRFAQGEAGARAWMEMTEKYGTGRDLYGILTGHLGRMAREIAFTDKWGPDYRATFGMLHRDAAQAELLGGKKAPLIWRWIESPAAAQRTFDVLTGKASEVQSEAMAGIFGGIRGFLSAAQLGSAAIPSVPGDSMTLALAARHNGIPAARVLNRALQMMVDSPNKRQSLSRLGIVAHAVSDSLVGAARYLDDSFFRPGATGSATRKFHAAGSGAANFVLRAQGLQGWSQAISRAFHMEMLGLVAEQSSRSFARLDEPFRRFLTRRGITAAEWDVLRKTPAINVLGADFFDIDGVADANLAEKLMAGIIDERRYAFLEPSAIVQQFSTQALPRGTMMGEISRSGFMYKSFPMMMMVMHMSRAWTLSPGHRAAYLGALALATTMAGAAAVQVKQLIAGKDPRPMNPMDSPEFWGAAFLQGGALGIFGDFLYSGFTRGGAGLVSTAAGPVAGLGEQAGRLAFPAIRRAFEGEDTRFSAELARAIRWNAPGTNLWYSRLAMDRLLWDQVQSIADPDYRGAHRRLMQRAQRDYGQGYWWKPGTRQPQRAPDFGNAVGN